MTVLVVRGDARRLPLPDASVDLIVTSPPYFALRSYTDGGAHYPGQIGSEATPAEYIAALIDCTREWVRVLKPSGSIFVDLGDKYVSTPPGNERSLANSAEYQRKGKEGYDRAWRCPLGLKQKSLMLLPERYRIACVDQLGLIARAVLVWAKPNGLPESVTDRVRRSHEDWVHLVKQPRYFAAVDEIRDGYQASTISRNRYARPVNGHPSGDHTGPLRSDRGVMAENPLGKLPGSVWTIPTEPLKVPEHLGVDHFATFPSEWPRQLILGWSPPGVCTACGFHPDVRDLVSCPHCGSGRLRPSVIADPFSGTGTVMHVASALGRIGVGTDLSRDYCRLAMAPELRDARLRKVLGLDKPEPVPAGQLELDGWSA